MSSCNVNVQGCAAFECIPRPPRDISSILFFFFFSNLFFEYLATRYLERERRSYFTARLLVDGSDAKLSRSRVVVVHIFFLAGVCGSRGLPLGQLLWHHQKLAKPRANPLTNESMSLCDHC